MTKVLINENLVKGFCSDDREEFTKLLRLEPEQLNFILGKIMLQIERVYRRRKGLPSLLDFWRAAVIVGLVGVGRSRLVIVTAHFIQMDKRFTTFLDRVGEEAELELC